MKKYLIFLLLAGFCRADLVPLSEKVGQKIDADERRKYGLFEREDNFGYAVFLQLKDGTYTLNIVYNDGSSKTRLLTDDEFKTLRRYVDEFETKKPEFTTKKESNLREGLLYTLFFTIGSSIMIGPSLISD